MNNTTKTTLFIFSHLDYTAMEEYFESMARKGWMLTKIGTITASFRKIDPQELKFTVDIFPDTTAFDSPNNREVTDYRELCEQSGWRFVASANKLNVFYANPGESPTPIQTDSIVEEKIVRRSVLGAEFLVFALCFPMFWLRMGKLFPFNYESLFTNLDLVSAVYFPLFLIPIMLYTGYYVLWFWKAKRNIKEGLPLPQTSLRAARFRGLFLFYIAALLVVLMLVAVIADAIGGRIIGLYAMLLPGISIGGALWFRKTVATKQRTRRQNMVTYVTTVVLLTIISLALVNILIIRGSASWAGMKENLPQGYVALRLSDFNLTEPPHAASFSRSSSFLVPASYDYYEISNEGTIRTRYIRATSPGLARYIFDGMLKRSERSYNRNVSLAPAEVWNADEAYYLTDDRSMVLLIQDSVVIHLDSKFDFAENRLVEISRFRLELD